MTSSVSSAHSAKRSGSETSSQTASGGAGTTAVAATVRSGLLGIARAVSTKRGGPWAAPFQLDRAATPREQLRLGGAGRRRGAGQRLTGLRGERRRRGALPARRGRAADRLEV